MIATVILLMSGVALATNDYSAEQLRGFKDSSAEYENSNPRDYPVSTSWRQWYDDDHNNNNGLTRNRYYKQLHEVASEEQPADRSIYNRLTRLQPPPQDYEYSNVIRHQYNQRPKENKPDTDFEEYLSKLIPVDTLNQYRELVNPAQAARSYTHKFSNYGKILSSGPPFSYDRSSPNGPDNWHLDSPDCGKRRQSPININLDTLVDTSYPNALRWTGYDIIPSEMDFTNTGHSVELTGVWKSQPYLSGGPLKSKYVFEQMHFHWGSNDDQGSEHEVNSGTFPMELHWVHYKKEYGNLTNALKFKDGAAVVAFTFEINNIGNSGISVLTSHLRDIQTSGKTTRISKPFALKQFADGFHQHYVTYAGSLTTPPCSQAVTWLIAAQPIYISKRQISAFRTLQGDDGLMSDNFRDTQPLNGRTVFYVQ